MALLWRVWVLAVVVVQSRATSVLATPFWSPQDVEKYYGEINCSRRSDVEMLRLQLKIAMARGGCAILTEDAALPAHGEGIDDDRMRLLTARQTDAGALSKFIDVFLFEEQFFAPESLIRQSFAAANVKLRCSKGIPWVTRQRRLCPEENDPELWTCGSRYKETHGERCKFAGRPICDEQKGQCITRKEMADAKEEYPGGWEPLSRDNVAPVWQFDFHEQDSAGRDERIGISQCAKQCREAEFPFFAQLERSCFCLEQGVATHAEVVPQLESNREGYQVVYASSSIFIQENIQRSIDEGGFEMPFSNLQRILRDAWLGSHGRIMAPARNATKFAKCSSACRESLLEILRHPCFPKMYTNLGVNLRALLCTALSADGCGIIRAACGM